MESTKCLVPASSTVSVKVPTSLLKRINGCGLNKKLMIILIIFYNDNEMINLQIITMVLDHS